MLEGTETEESGIIFLDLTRTEFAEFKISRGISETFSWISDLPKRRVVAQ